MTGLISGLAEFKIMARTRVYTKTAGFAAFRVNFYDLFHKDRRAKCGCHFKKNAKRDNSIMPVSVFKPPYGRFVKL